MPLTPQDVHNKVFGPTRFRRGYDEGEVDSFLDEVEVELTRLHREIETLRSRVGEPTGGAATDVTGTEAGAGQQPFDGGHTAGLGSAPGQMEPADGFGTSGGAEPVEAELVEPAESPSGAQAGPTDQTAVQLAKDGGQAAEPADLEQRVARALVLAQRAADEAVADAERQAEELRAAARAEADRIRREAEAEAERMRGELERSRSDAEGEVEQLRAFEREYRTRLRAYLQLQLKELESGRSGGQGSAALGGDGGGGGAEQAGIAAGDVTDEAGMTTERHRVAVAPPVTSDSPEAQASSPDDIADSDRSAGVSPLSEGQELRHEPRGLHDDL
jgi:DivIVA domain-containing protein